MPLRFHLGSLGYLVPGLWCLVAAVPLALGFVSDWFYATFTCNAFGLGIVACVSLALVGAPSYYRAVMHRAAARQMTTRQRRVVTGGLWLTALAALIGAVVAIPTIVTSILSAAVLAGSARLLWLYRDAGNAPPR